MVEISLAFERGRRNKLVNTCRQLRNIPHSLGVDQIPDFLLNRIQTSYCRSHNWLVVTAVVILREENVHFVHQKNRVVIHLCLGLTRSRFPRFRQYQVTHKRPQVLRCSINLRCDDRVGHIVEGSVPDGVADLQHIVQIVKVGFVSVHQILVVANQLNLVAG
uniref:(northern house mosquito) hypothetical protein n=1 Tax=Culex pipiens TaxID=7175 RepID=A0A8D7ZY82_CULPI